MVQILNLTDTSGVNMHNNDDAIENGRRSTTYEILMNYGEVVSKKKKEFGLGDVANGY